jgi:hypothetical protein
VRCGRPLKSADEVLCSAPSGGQPGSHLPPRLCAGLEGRHGAPGVNPGGQGEETGRSPAVRIPTAAIFSKDRSCMMICGTRDPLRAPLAGRKSRAERHLVDGTAVDLPNTRTVLAGWTGDTRLRAG